MSARRVSVVVPTYREADNVPTLVERLFRALEAGGIDAELIIVDDDSRDGTADSVAALSTRHPIRLITRTGVRGLSSAVVRGFDEAAGDILVCMDADLSHPPEAVPDLVAPVAQGHAEFVIGSRYATGGRTTEDWGLLRRINSLGATLLARPLTAVRDPLAGFFCTRRDVLERARRAGLNAIGYKIALELLIKSRTRHILEVPITFSDRLHGKSKLTIRQQLLYLRHLLQLYRFRFPYLMPAAGAALLVAAAALAVIRLQ